MYFKLIFIVLLYVFFCLDNKWREIRHIFTHFLERITKFQIEFLVMSTIHISGMKPRKANRLIWTKN